MSTKESAARQMSRGQWGDPGVPHKGWRCVGTEDMGYGEENHITCEMCEIASVRYVHFLEHDDYPETLSVGCICAEHMEEDYVAPREREKRLRSEAGKKERRELAWISEKWRRSQNGNLWVKRRGYTATIFGEGPYKFCISADERRYFSKQEYSSGHEAKIAIGKTVELLKWNDQ